MKRYLCLFLSLMLVLNVCAQTKATNISEIVDYKISTIDSANDVFIVATMMNKTNEVLLVADCDCWYNARPYLSDTKKYKWGIAIKVDPACERHFKEIRPGEEQRWRYPYSMNFVYDIPLRGRNLMLVYYGAIKDKQGRTIKERGRELNSNVVEL